MGIWEVFEIHWSKKPFIAPLFYHIWGWPNLSWVKRIEIDTGEPKDEGN